MTLGRQLRRPELPTVGASWCEAALPAGSVYRFLARERAWLFPPELFADLFQATGRRSVPPSILAVVMVLQRLEGLSDREAADRFCFDVRWRYAAGVADAVAGEETASFASTVLVDFRARLRASADPDRIFRVTCELARQVGLVGVRRVLDSAPLEDGVATQDTVTMLRGAIRRCFGLARLSWRPRSGVCCSARTTMPHWASRPATGRTGRPGRVRVPEARAGQEATVDLTTVDTLQQPAGSLRPVQRIFYDQNLAPGVGADPVRVGGGVYNAAPERGGVP